MFQAAIAGGALPLVIVGVLSSAVAAFFYVRVIVLMFFSEPALRRPERRQPRPVHRHGGGDRGAHHPGLRRGARAAAEPGEPCRQPHVRPLSSVSPGERPPGTPRWLKAPFLRHGALALPARGATPWNPRWPARPRSFRHGALALPARGRPPEPPLAQGPVPSSRGLGPVGPGGDLRWLNARPGRPPHPRRHWMVSGGSGQGIPGITVVLMGLGARLCDHSQPGSSWHGTRR